MYSIFSKTKNGLCVDRERFLGISANVVDDQIIQMLSNLVTMTAFHKFKEMLVTFHKEVFAAVRYKS